MSVATYIMAVYIGSILDFLKYLPLPHVPRPARNMRSRLFEFFGQNGCAHPTNEESGKHSGEASGKESGNESGKEPVIESVEDSSGGSQNLDPTQPKAIEEGKGLRFTKRPDNVQT